VAPALFPLNQPADRNESLIEKPREDADPAGEFGGVELSVGQDASGSGGTDLPQAGRAELRVRRELRRGDGVQEHFGLFAECFFVAAAKQSLAPVPQAVAGE